MAVLKILDDGTIVDDCVAYGRSVDENAQSHKYGYERGYKTGYEKGANDAWELAKKVILMTEMGGIPNEELFDIFGKINPFNIMTKYSASDALKRYREYEEKKENEINEINVGDEVYQSENSMRVVVTKVYRDEGKFDALGYDGTVHSGLLLSLWKKTGKRCDIVIKKACEGGEK